MWAHLTSISHLTSKPIKIPFYKRSRHAIPRPFQPPPPRTLVYCCVVEVGDWAVRSNSPAWSQIMTSILPPPAQKFDQNPLLKTKSPRHPPAVSAQTPSSYVWLSCCPQFWPGRLFDFDRPVKKWRRSHHPPPPQRILSIFPLGWRASAPSPSRPSPHPGAHWLIVMFLRLATGRSDKICPPSRNLMMP